jgi:ATP/maltotriose-dependent transcriptional regulator MalT
LLRLDVEAALRFAGEIDRLGTAHEAAVPMRLLHASTVLKAAILAIQDDVNAATDLALRARLKFSGSDRCSITATICRLGFWKSGSLSEFRSLGSEVRGLGRCRHEACLAVFNLCLEAAVEFGRLRLLVAGRLATNALALARAGVAGESSAALLPASVLAQVFYEQGNLDEAEALIRYRLTAIRARGTIECAIRAYVLLARIATHRGRADRALILLDDAEGLGAKRKWSRLVAAALGERMRILLGEGEDAAAASCLRDLESFARRQRLASGPGASDVQTHLELARLRYGALQFRANDMAAAIYSLRQAALARGDLHLALELHLISITGSLERSDQSEVNEQLLDALDIGAAQGLCMMFVDSGPVVRKMLADFCHDTSTTDDRIRDLRPYVQTLVAQSSALHSKLHVPSQPSKTPRHPLTPRESNILRLIAGGLSNKRIAQRLDIAPETVKSHAKNIFAKLAAQTRAQAVAHAETLGLI